MGTGECAFLGLCLLLLVSDSLRIVTYITYFTPLVTQNLYRYLLTNTILTVTGPAGPATLLVSFTLYTVFTLTGPIHTILIVTIYTLWVNT